MQNVIYVVNVLKGTSEKRAVQSSKSEKILKKETLEMDLKRVGWKM